VVAGALSKSVVEMSWPGADGADNGLLLDRDLVLPDFHDPSKKAWPPYEVPLSMQIAMSMGASVR
jgi:hypothetical protein